MMFSFSVLLPLVQDADAVKENCMLVEEGSGQRPSFVAREHKRGSRQYQEDDREGRPRESKLLFTSTGACVNLILKWHQILLMLHKEIELLSSQKWLLAGEYVEQVRIPLQSLRKLN